MTFQTWTTSAIKQLCKENMITLQRGQAKKLSDALSGGFASISVKENKISGFPEELVVRMELHELD